MKIKDKLAKLLATENITVRHSASAKTASFDVKNRVLVLPIWSSLSKGRIDGKLSESDATDVYDLLVGHEVGHALYTPVDGWEVAIDEGLNKNILNIVEDPRIEKLIKRKYPGLRKAFLSGYSSLMQLGFFGETLDCSIESMNVLDRLNIHFKGGASLQVPFDDAELWMVEGIAACETWDDVVEITKKIQMAYSELLKQMPNSQSAFARFDEVETGADFDELQSDDMEGEWADEIEVNPSETLAEDQIDVEEFDAEDHEVDDDASETMGEWNKRKTELSQNTKAKDVFYIGLPTPIFKNVIISHKEVREELTEILNWNLERIAGVKETVHPHYRDRAELITKENWQTEYNKFRTSSQKIINYMVKEFERKKAADEYKRVSIDKTGILNVTKLHEYKYSDDLFLKRAIVHDGKNHGLVFLLDWSASMHYHMENTVKQLLSLVWFCNKVNIPFEVYAFTSSYYQSDWFDLDKGEREKLKRLRHMSPMFNTKHNDVYFDHDSGFKMLNMLSSRMSAPELNAQALNLFSIGHTYGIGGRILSLKQYELGSTPLVQALVCMQEIIPNFRNYHKLDKVNFICLTDGEANSSFTSVKNEHDPDLEKPAHRCVTPIPSSGRADVIFDDPKSRKTYHVNNVRQNTWRIYDGEEQTLFLLNLLKDRYDINTIGIFLDSGKSIDRHQLEKYLGWYSFNRAAHKAARKQCRTEGFATVKTAGYDEYYLVPTGSIKISDETGLPIDDGAAADMKKGQLRTMFAKNQKKKFGNRIMVNRMMDLIA